MDTWKLVQEALELMATSPRRTESYAAIVKRPGKTHRREILRLYVHFPTSSAYCGMVFVSPVVYSKATAIHTAIKEFVTADAGTEPSSCFPVTRRLVINENYR
jgi:hypothetical protein